MFMMMNFVLDRGKRTLVFSYDEQEGFDSPVWYVSGLKIPFVTVYRPLGLSFQAIDQENFFFFK